MATLSPYLNFNGNTLEAFTFYKNVFGGQFSALQFYKDIPGGDKMNEKDREKVVHVSLAISKDHSLMGTDTLTSPNQKLNVGDNFLIAVHAESVEEATKIFNALAEGGQITLPLEKAFWGDLSGMLIDKFNIQWIINYREIK